MWRSIASLLSAFALLGCSYAPRIYGSKDTDESDARGSVTALSRLLAQPSRPVQLVLLHGVGDHCPGYGLKLDTGWLKSDTLRVLGLTPKGDVTPHKVNANVFIGGAFDPRSWMHFQNQAFDLRLSGSTIGTAVRATEITWSTLTQWVKNQQLGYDAPSVRLPVLPDTDPTACPTVSVGAATKSPPSRLQLDELIKEQVFDRNLADAILYVGSYGEAIERGVADVLCRMLTEQKTDHARCIWPTKEQLQQRDERFVFVTHSLGSRILYDVIVHLHSAQAVGRENPFKPEDIRAMNPAITYLLAHTEVIYMMANQIPMLGLANAPANAKSSDGSSPLSWALQLQSTISPALQGALGNAPPFVQRALGRVPTTTKAPASFGNVLDALGEMRVRSAEELGETPRPLRIVAFNDTNDLLTWHLPNWYAHSTQAPDGTPAIDLANVFVRNAFPWLVIEHPLNAHVDYFSNKAVWQVISCGVTEGKLNEPCP